jgi:hypothetical protein
MNTPVLAAVATALVLCGCTTPVPPYAEAQPNCVEMRGDKCVAWVFGPTRTQKARFNRPQGSQQ